MSKSRGNVIGPDDVAESHSADILRVYETPMGPPEAVLPWSTAGPDRARRQLDRVWRLHTGYDEFTEANDGKLDKVYHTTVKRVTNDVETLNLNTAISQMMTFIDECYKAGGICVEYTKGSAKISVCFTPHMGEEIRSTVLGGCGTITYEPQPTYSEAKLVEDVIKVVIQINGKLHGRFTTEVGGDGEAMRKQALEISAAAVQIGGKTIRKIIVVKGEVVNIVVN